MNTGLNIPEHLHELENQLLQSAIRISADKVAALLADEFVEFGSSGRVWNKQSIIASLQEEVPIQRLMQAFKAKMLAPDVALVTYRVTRPRTDSESARNALHSSIWKLIDGRWQMIFHQGTLSNPAP